VPDVRILDPAQVPEVPVEDERRRILLLGFLGAVFLAIAGVLLADRFDPRLRYPQQVSHDMGVPVLGLVPRLKRRRGRFAQGEQYHGVEALRSIRLSVANAFGTAGPLALTISSPQPGDGKSFIALNLAVSYAEMGRRTLLVDGDTRRGKLHRTLGVDRKPGLTEFLAGLAGVEEVIRRGAGGTPDLIPCGTRRSDAPELLTRRRMRELLALARSEYEVIIVDTPPLGVGADPLILTGFTGHLLLVLRAGATNRIGASAQLEPVRASPVRLLGAVLNDVPAGASYGYYPYRYVPGYEARDEEEGTERTTRLLPI
jgi:capsular exopolysaccharide synthesis family protein